MASNWKELEQDLLSGAAQLPNPIPDAECGIGTNTVPSGLEAPEFGETPLEEFTGGIQDEIDNFAAEVDSVLQDIGAWLPSTSSSPNFSESESTKPSAAPQVAKIEYTTSAGGEVIEAAGHDPDTGDSYRACITSSGGAWHLDPDGSVKLTSGKNPDTDPLTGGIHLLAQGPGTQKYGEFLLIEVNNNSKALDDAGAAAKSGATAGIAFSLIVNGNIKIESRSGDISVGGRNVSITASDVLELNSPEIKLNAGKTASTTSGGKISQDQGGSIELNAGIIKKTQASEQKIEGATYKRVDGEDFSYISNSQGGHTLKSSGTLVIESAGDMIEQIGGRKLTEVAATAGGVSLEGLIPPKPQLIGSSAGYIICNTFPIVPSAGKDSADQPPPVVHIDGPASGGGSGFKVTSTLGNIGIFSTLGSVAIGSNYGAFADITNPFKDPRTPKNILSITTPGTYVTSLDNLSMMAVLQTSLSVGKKPPAIPVTDAITLLPAAMKIDSKGVLDVTTKGVTNITGSVVNILGKGGIFLN